MKIMGNPMNKWMIWEYPYCWKYPGGGGDDPPDFSTLSPTDMESSLY